MQVTPAGRGVCIPLFFHDDIMALFAITFSGSIGIVLFRFTLGLNSLERNGIVLFLLTLGLKAQKQSARGRASASPRVSNTIE